MDQDRQDAQRRYDAEPTEANRARLLQVEAREGLADPFPSILRLAEVMDLDHESRPLIWCWNPTFPPGTRLMEFWGPHTTGKYRARMELRISGLVATELGVTHVDDPLTLPREFAHQSWSGDTTIELSWTGLLRTGLDQVRGWAMGGTYGPGGRSRGYGKILGGRLEVKRAE